MISNLMLGKIIVSNFTNFNYLPGSNGEQYNDAFFSLLTIINFTTYLLWETWSSYPVPFFMKNGDKIAFPPGVWDTIFGRIKIPRWFVSDIIYPAPARSRLTLLMSSAGGQESNWGEQVGRKHPRNRPSPLRAACITDWKKHHCHMYSPGLKFTISS